MVKVWVLTLTMFIYNAQHILTGTQSYTVITANKVKCFANAEGYLKKPDVAGAYCFEVYVSNKGLDKSNFK